MPALANSYLACHLYNIDPEDRADGPFIITQEAFDPEDVQMVNTVFLLRRDGLWIDEMAQPLGSDEHKFLVFFDSPREAAEAMEKLEGEPVIERHSLTIADLRARVVALQGNGYITLRLQLAERYRQWRREHHSPGEPSF